MDNNGHKIIFFCCHNAIDFKNFKGLEQRNLEIIELSCSSKTEILHLLKLFENGMDGIGIIGCLEGECHFSEGNLRAKKRVQFTKRLLDEIGLNGNRLKMYNVSTLDEEKFAGIINEMVQKIKKLGKNPIR